MITEKIINHTMLDTLRVRILFGIAYKESPDEARRVVIEAIQPDERLDPSYPPKVVVTELSDSAVSMELRLYLKETAMESPVRTDYQELVFTTLKAAGIEIPFPHTTIYFGEDKHGEAPAARIRTEEPEAAPRRAAPPKKRRRRAAADIVELPAQEDGADDGG